MIRSHTDFQTISAVDVVLVVAVFTQVLQVGIIESQTVAADFQFSHALGTFVVLVAGGSVSEESSLLGTLELLGRCWNTYRDKNQR